MVYDTGGEGDGDEDRHSNNGKALPRVLGGSPAAAPNSMAHTSWSASAMTTPALKTVCMHDLCCMQPRSKQENESEQRGAPCSHQQEAGGAIGTYDAATSSEKTLAMRVRRATERSTGRGGRK